MGRSRMQRFYAIVQTNNGDLGEQLVENGLARIHGFQASPEGITSARREWQKLTRLERKAKQEKVGGWGAKEGRMMSRAQAPESTRGVDPFDSFFHPERVGQNAENPQASPARSQSTNGTTVLGPNDIAPEMKLDVNTASQAELENVSGIGPVKAARIIEARPFKSADDLRNIKGIGDKLYARIRPYFK